MGRRTPLMRAMRELADVHASLPQDRPLSLDEAIELQRRRFSRRQVLRGVGVLGAGLAVAQPFAALARPRRRGAHEPRVVVVGAGLAGVSCAYKLQQHGIRADLYESRDRVGGRCWSARTFADGQVAEHGGEFVDTRHVQLRRLVAALGLHLDDLFPAYEDEGDVTGLLVLEGEQRDRHEVHAHFDAVIRRLMRDAKRVGPHRWGQAGPAAKAFDQMTMREWMDDNVPGGWVAPRPVEGTSVSPGSGGSTPRTPRRSRCSTRTSRRIPADRPTSAITSEAGTIRCRTSPVVADHVVLCLPFTTLRDVDLTEAGFDAKRMRAIDELGMGTNAKVLLQFEDRFPTFGWNGLFDLDVPKTDSWGSALAEPGPGGLLTIFSGGKTGAGYPVDQPHAPAPSGVVDDALTFLDTYLPARVCATRSTGARGWTRGWTTRG